MKYSKMKKIIKEVLDSLEILNTMDEEDLTEKKMISDGVFDDYIADKKINKLSKSELLTFKKLSDEKNPATTVWD